MAYSAAASIANAIPLLFFCSVSISLTSPKYYDIICMLSNILFDYIISIFGRTIIKSKEMYVIEHFFKFVRRKIMDRRQQKTRKAIFMHSAHCLKRKATIISQYKKYLIPQTSAEVPFMPILKRKTNY